MIAKRSQSALFVFCLAVTGFVAIDAPSAQADNRRLNNDVAANVYTIQHQHGCTNDLTINPHATGRPVAHR